MRLTLSLVALLLSVFKSQPVTALAVPEVRDKVAERFAVFYTFDDSVEDEQRK
ncbi:hypothetical protein PILCRDRAFT_11934 [Piloderma croceum F 1598]|uniref:Uncharacterized protein n=1 Tax=Piloderma croceum (strain F 1598) TaxID=765440 RepID=A0A0C3BJE2_PILCF|nr:hypothetical protein PILCRDRAFT_11934 [Piloderma croceum F 1598]